MAERTGTVLIAGVSTRALAQSAVRAGVRCRAVDAFGDLDQAALLPVVGLRRGGQRYSASAAARVARTVEADAVAYVANFENHPAAVRRLAAGRLLLGNGPEVLARARDVALLAEVARAAGADMPETLAPARAGRADPAGDWLRKPARGGGGSGIRPWRPGTPLAPHELAQRRVAGTPASLVFLADGRRACPLGLSRQLVGDPCLGARGLRYCGSLYPLALPPALERRAVDLAGAATEAFGLRGVNGIDFVLGDGRLWVLELNPRYPASAELVERATGLSVFEAHAAACAGELPSRPPSPPAGVWGKGVVYARTDAHAPATERWLERGDVHDVPHPGERLRAGSPVCSVFGQAPDMAACYAALVAGARSIEEELDGAGGGGRDDE